MRTEAKIMLPQSWRSIRHKRCLSTYVPGRGGKERQCKKFPDCLRIITFLWTSNSMTIPQKIGKYTILERIGRGGMGYVYRAHDPILKRDVALKTMLKDVSDDEELRNRFMREAQSAGGL